MKFEEGHRVALKPVHRSQVRGAARLRRPPQAVIALTVAKVFLIDASGLTGLTRVVSFLGLGLFVVYGTVRAFSSVC